MVTYDIQELVELSRVPRRTIYFYIQQGIIPPPQGAGLAAKYHEEHLLRLQLIPVFRREGLRLDEIRSLYNQMGEQEMREKRDRAMDSTFLLLKEPSQSYSGESQLFLQFPLPKGIQLFVPKNLNAEEHRKVEQWVHLFSATWDEKK